MKRWKTPILLVLCVHMLALTTVWAQNPAVAPTPRTQMVFGNRGETWMGRFYSNVRQIQGDEVDLLLIGDSITHGWERGGSATFEKYYGHRSAVNLGFGGDRTQHVLWRLIEGDLQDITPNPKVAVIMIGTNNTNSDTPNEIAAGIRAICNTLRGQLPETKILLLAIFPRGRTAGDWRRAINEATNSMIAELDDGEWIHYLDIGQSFLEPDGDLPESIMPDALHPNERGYEIWAEAMEPMLARLMADTPVR